METLYILECEDDKWYVGKTNDVSRRFKQHQEGKGAAWTKEYKPLRIAETRQIVSSHDETNVTKDLMKKYGVDNVRGGAYSQMELSEDIESLIKHELKANTDACYKCGKRGHFSNRCSKQEEIVICLCAYCDKEFSSESMCEKHEKSCARGSTQRSYGSCYKCGRKGHWAPDCYAKTHTKGYELD